MGLSSQGIQGHDIVPQQIGEDYSDLFRDSLPGWALDREYNYTAAASTQRAALQLETLLHSGPHKWINDALESMLNELRTVPDPQVKQA